ncbi:MAG: metallophosphoesterase [Colwellia sp.]
MSLSESYSSSAVQHKAVIVAQITDSHLFSSPDGLHHGKNVLDNLKKVLFNICQNPHIKHIIFTGDLTQDHTEQSYQNFVHCVHECRVTVPVYYVAGNHDDPELLTKYFSEPPFLSDKTITFPNWQIQLIDSKSETPAGYVSEHALAKLSTSIDKDKSQLLMMHHHPTDVGYFIDKHGLQNKMDFWQAMNSYNNIEGIACGHVHGAIELTSPLSRPLTKTFNESLNKPRNEQPKKAKESVTVYTCPATSIQFDPSADGAGALDLGPGYRIFYLYPDSQLLSDVVML